MRSITGVYNSRFGPLQFESKLERDTYVSLDFEPYIKHVRVQPIKIGNYVPDCLVAIANEIDLLCEIKYESELVREWTALNPKFERADIHASTNGMNFGFVTDNSVYRHPYRLSALKWINFLARSQKQEETSFQEIETILENQTEITIRRLATNIIHGKLSSTLAQICKFISSGTAYVKDTPSQDPMETIISKISDKLDNTSCSIFTPYQKAIDLFGNKGEKNIGRSN